MFVAVSEKRSTPAPRFSSAPAVPGTDEIGIVAAASRAMDSVAPFAPICTVAPASPQMNEAAFGRKLSNRVRAMVPPSMISVAEGRTRLKLNAVTFAPPLTVSVPEEPSRRAIERRPFAHSSPPVIVRMPSPRSPTETHPFVTLKSPPEIVNVPVGRIGSPPETSSPLASLSAASLTFSDCFSSRHPPDITMLKSFVRPQLIHPLVMVIPSRM